MAEQRFYATGKRKSAIARVYMKAGKKPEHWKKTSERVAPVYEIKLQKATEPGEPDLQYLS